jgi:hypothetical protein
MISGREFAWLHALQGDLAARRDWVAVAHLQALIEHIADKHIDEGEVSECTSIQHHTH